MQTTGHPQAFQTKQAEAVGGRLEDGLLPLAVLLPCLEPRHAGASDIVSFTMRRSSTRAGLGPQSVQFRLKLLHLKKLSGTKNCVVSGAACAASWCCGVTGFSACIDSRVSLKAPGSLTRYYTDFRVLESKAQHDQQRGTAHPARQTPALRSKGSSALELQRLPSMGQLPDHKHGVKSTNLPA